LILPLNGYPGGKRGSIDDFDQFDEKKLKTKSGVVL
jgi:hypothetical protein